MRIEVRTPEQLKKMRTAGDILRNAQKAMQARCLPGVSLKELDAIADDVIRSAGGIPNFFGFHGFPASICTMLNDDVVHGIPDDRVLQEGDLLSVDGGVLWQGWNSDAAFSLVVGGAGANEKREKFHTTVREALLAGCEAARDGNCLGDIGYAIESVIKKSPYSICKEYTGHGIGKEMHEEPYVFNYGNQNTGARLKSGMTFCIEPIIAAGNPQVKTMSDGWLVRTVDGKDGCQWEHCGVVTSTGLEIFA
jgi:methionyl aminopeptidase